MYPVQTIVLNDKARTIYYNPYNKEVFIYDKIKGNNTAFELKGSLDAFLEKFAEKRKKAKRKQHLLKVIKQSRRNEKLAHLRIIRAEKRAEKMAFLAEKKAAKNALKAQRKAESETKKLLARMSRKGIVL
ncbi:MAG: hypothetical protein ACLFP1_01615 [Candidatus Goldiibacteriota bacterium]